MHLKSLTLKGFKSFARPTTFQFEPGVTAIVGPNGSGKSNVVDALAWVMGEQGAKTLRGGKMEDVIFAGTSTRGPLGRAEVRLTIDNADGALPIEYTEVTISRTLFRNGASEYAINGDPCRLLDVQELLSDSGLGREMHVIVGQGQLDAVLRATPEDRRGFIEEAAGILKHRRRKERTLRKLDAMDTNLTRLNDLAAELRRQLTPLGRQAEVARQAQTIAAEARDAKARLLADDVFHLRRELDQLAGEDSERHSERIVLQEQVEQKQLRIARLEQEQQGDDLDAARRVTLSLEAAQSKLRGLFAQAEQRLAFLASQAEPKDSIPRLGLAAVEDAGGEADRLTELIPAAESAWERARAVTRSAQLALDGIDEHIAAQSELVSRHDLQISQLSGRVETARARLAAAEQDAARRDQAGSQADVRAEEASEALQSFEREHPAATDATSPERETAYREAQEHLADAERRRDEARDRLHGLEQERAGLAARVSALTRALDQRDASAAVLAAEPAGISGRVSDRVRVREGHEAAIAAALGLFADAILADDASAAAEAVSMAQERDLGRVRVVVEGARSSAGTAVGGGASMPVGVAGLTPAVDTLIEAPEGVRGLLAGCFLANDFESATRGFASLGRSGSTTGITVVTASGDVLSEHTVSGGSTLAPSRIELAAELEQAVQRQERVAAEITAVEVEFGNLVEEAAGAREASERAFSALRAADAQLAEIAQERNRLLARAEAARAEADRARQAAEAATTSIAAAAADVAAADHALDEAKAAPRPILDVGERDALLAELETARAAEMEARLALETARERARAAATHHETLAEQLEMERRAADEAARRAVLRARQVTQAERVSEVLPAILDACDRSLSEARTVQHAAEAERARHSQELTLLRAEEAELREQLQVLTERVHGAELKAYERKLQLSTLLERSGDELGLVEDVLIAEYGPDVPIAVVDEAEGAEASTCPYVREEQEERLARAEKQLGRLGRINPLALEEFAALEQRHTFLTEQLQDLTKTRSDLLAIIDDLDERMQGIFSEAFEDTRAAFAEVFPVLFPGGTGEIYLSDPDDLLATGIEMAVKPAGKKVERLSLLSGGERSLAAVAWLIAIFRARPSPFYIMDEVEAALDDANLGRLLQVFEGLRAHSQLIVITHQKRTMEIADALYGVSMRHDGVSAVVGQRIGAE